ncbi:MAG: hypothetical protein ACK5LN_04710 [Propioniciclava sp.]
MKPAPDDANRAAGRPAALVAAVIATGGFSVAFLVLAVLALRGGHGAFSGHVAVGLLVWGLVNAIAAVALGQLRWWARGLVVALGLLHLLAFGQSMLVAPWAGVGLLAALVAVVGASWPSTRTVLHPWRRTVSE